ncbi:MAG: MFS transporter [Alicyclobacillaceae bacterium]|nr:MFS transporter [Alicyclobacillaceae bacterium]
MWIHGGFHSIKKHREFRWLWLASSINSLGDELGAASILWATIRLSGSLSDLGLLFLAGAASALVSPIAGVLGDRFSRTKLMVSGNCILAIVTAGLGIIIWTYKSKGNVPFWMILCPVLVSFIVQPLAQVGAQQIISEFVPKEEWDVANSVYTVSSQLTWFLGPTLAGILVSAYGLVVPLFIDVFSFLLCAFFLYRIPFKKYESNITIRKLSINFIEGYRYLLRHRILIYNSAIVFFFSFFFGVYGVGLPLLANRQFGGPAAYGVLWSLFAVGTLIGGIIFSSRSWKLPIAKSMNTVVVLWGLLTLLLLINVDSVIWVGLVMLLTGLVYAPYDPYSAILLQRVVSGEMLGKVSGSIRPLTGLGGPIGGFLSGIGVSYLGIHGLFFVSGIGTVAVGVIALLLPSFRNFDRDIKVKTE